MRRLLWVGDAVASTGFARGTRGVLDVLRETWDIKVLGLNYFGDPHDWPYDIYPCYSGGDAFGLNRIAQLVEELKPELVVIQNDPWNIPKYMVRIGDVPVVAVMAVDGKNCRGAALHGGMMDKHSYRGIVHAIFWTEFALKEAREGGYAGPASVIPLGVDLDIYNPGNRLEARKRVGLPDSFSKAFIVGNVNRNQPRKRLDLTISFFADWVTSRKIDDAYLMLHVAPTGEEGYDVRQLMMYYRLPGRLVLVEPPVGPGVLEKDLADVYRCFDVQVSTTQGEGWGLCTMEGMACGIPQIVPDWSALGEWARGAAELVPCSEIAVTFNNINAVGGVPDRGKFIEVLDRLYREEDRRNFNASAGLAFAKLPKYRWENIGREFAVALETVWEGRTILRKEA